MNKQDITATDRYDLRYSEMNDEKHLLEWTNNPEIMKWLPAGNEEELRIFVRNWIGFSRLKCSLTATIDRIPCAIGTLFLMPYRKVAHMSMLYMVVHRPYQNMGIGTSVLKNLAHLAKNYFRLKSLHLEVYEGCPIIPLLQKLGYYECFHQKGYVHNDDGSFLARRVYEVSLIHD
jgi:putative acetyltransferase